MRKTLWMVPSIVLTALHAVPVFATDLDLTASGWSITSNSENVATLHNDAGGALYFDFPQMPDTSCIAQGPCNTVNYLTTTNVPSTIVGMLSITLRVETLTGTPVFQHTEDGPNPPSVRAFLEGDANHGDRRYWSHQIDYTIGPGTVTMNVPLDPALWSDTYGQFANQTGGTLNRWEHALDDLVRLGVTFGGGGAFGHGVFTTGGTARFTLENYEVTPIPDCPSFTPCNGVTCLQGAETGDSDTSLYQCVQPGGSLLKCPTDLPLEGDPQCSGPTCPRVHTISTNCQQAPCCTQTPFPCLCISCSGGSYLECRCEDEGLCAQP